MAAEPNALSLRAAKQTTFRTAPPAAQRPTTFAALTVVLDIGAFLEDEKKEREERGENPGEECSRHGKAYLMPGPLGEFEGGGLHQASGRTTPRNNVLQDLRDVHYLKFAPIPSPHPYLRQRHADDLVALARPNKL